MHRDKSIVFWYSHHELEKIKGTISFLCVYPYCRVPSIQSWQRPTRCRWYITGTKWLWQEALTFSLPKKTITMRKSTSISQWGMITMTTTRSGSGTIGDRVHVLIGTVAGASALRATAPIQNWQPAFSENIGDAFIRNDSRCGGSIQNCNF